MKAKIQIENVQSAVPAVQLSCIFSQRGGIIGAGEDVTWRIQDNQNNISENAAKIEAVEDRFTIEALPKTKIRINGSKSAIRVGRKVILSDKDQLSLGGLNLTVHLGQEQIDRSERGNVVNIIDEEHGNRKQLLIDGEYIEPQVASDAIPHKPAEDPVKALDGKISKHTTSDPLSVFDETQEKRQSEEETILQESTQKRFDGNEVTSLPDLTNTQVASASPKRVRKDRYGFDEAYENLEHTGDVDQVSISLDQEVDHIALRPLIHGLGVSLGDMSPTEANRLLGEIGSALRFAIKGLNHIYASRSGLAGRFPLATMHMHAIEDNPLRFSHDVEEALDALFAKRGRVHLSAPFAIKETLTHLDNHQNATEKAVDRALDTVLRALSPNALKRRFRSYDNAEEPEAGTMHDAWCWQMYKAYSSEMHSKRQQGLQMLFWEVFSQEYQSIMRNFELGLDEMENEEAINE